MSTTVGIEQKQRDRYVHRTLVAFLLLTIFGPLLALAWLGGWLP